MNLLKENYFDKYVLILNRSLWLALKTKNFQLYQYYNVIFFDFKNERV